MEFSWEALAGIGIAVAMLAAAVYRRVSTRNRENTMPVSKKVSSALKSNF